MFFQNTQAHASRSDSRSGALKVIYLLYIKTWRDESKFNNFGGDKLEVCMPAKKLLQMFANIWSGVSLTADVGL